MNTLKEFVAYFTNEEIPYITHKQTCYTPTTIPAEGNLQYMSERLGVEKRNSFTPSFVLLDKIAPHTHKKAVVNEKSAWMFICQNNILKEGIVTCEQEKGHVLVTNERGEVLGYGKITGAGITNQLDRGDYLRRER